MSPKKFPPVDITAQWGRLNDTLIALIDCIPDEEMDWRPTPELWNFRGILLHTITARDNWLGDVVKDGEQAPDVLETARSKDGMRQEFRRSWERMERFLREPDKLAAEYETRRGQISGHWIAFHLLEHDIHHRADIFHYLGLLDIKHPEIGTP